MTTGNTKIDRVFLAPFTYKLFFTEARGVSTHGETSTDRKEIVVHSIGTEESIKETLLHEILHVLFEDLIGTIRAMECKDEEAEETLIRLLSPRIFQFIRENTELIEYLQEVEQEEENE